MTQLEQGERNSYLCTKYVFQAKLGQLRGILTKLNEFGKKFTLN